MTNEKHNNQLSKRHTSYPFTSEPQSCRYTYVTWCLGPFANTVLSPFMDKLMGKWMGTLMGTLMSHIYRLSLYHLYHLDHLYHLSLPEMALQRSKRIEF